MRLSNILDDLELMVDDPLGEYSKKSFTKASGIIGDYIDKHINKCSEEEVNKLQQYHETLSQYENRYHFMHSTRRYTEKEANIFKDDLSGFLAAYRRYLKYLNPRLEDRKEINNK